MEGGGSGGGVELPGWFKRDVIGDKGHCGDGV